MDERFLALYHENKNRVFNMLMVCLNFNRSEAEGIFKAVIHKASLLFGEFDSQKTDFKVWIFSLVHVQLADSTQESRGAQFLSPNVPYGSSDAPANGPKSEMDEGGKIRALFSGIGQTERELVVLRHMEGLEYADISRITGRKEGAIRTGLSRAMDHLAILYKRANPKPLKSDKPKSRA
jgi:DNA-directed RNA polymerase specialized sigma24 family protein